MKIISLEMKKVSIVKFFPKENKVELDILFNDGSDKEIFKTVDVSDAEGSAEAVLADLRKMERNIHKNSESDNPIVDNLINIVVKNENETIKEIARFIAKVGANIEEIKGKNAAEGYLERIRQLKSLKVDFT